MFTNILTKDNQELNYVSQQYEVGLYYIINNNAKLQGNSILKEEEFHIKLRKRAIKNNDKIVSGTYIEYKSKKFNINPFL